MGDMLDNRDFDGGGEDVGSEATTSEENTEVQSSEDTQEEIREETNNTEETTEESVVEENTSTEAENNVDETTKKTQDVSEAQEQVAEVKPTRAQRRIQKLIAERKAQEERIRELSASQQPAIQPNEDGEIEMTPDQLTGFISQQVQTTLQAEREQRFTQERAEAWDDDISELMESTPELNPESKQFNKSLSDSLVELIRVANTDDNGNPTVRKLPSEVYATLQNTIDAAKNAGKKEASVGLEKKAQETAIQSTSQGTVSEEKYTDEQLANLQHTDPRKYAELIENNII